VAAVQLTFLGPRDEQLEAVSTWPIQRMQCARRAGPGGLAEQMAVAAAAQDVRVGTRRSVMRISQWLPRPAIVSTSRTTSHPSPEVDEERGVAGLGGSASGRSWR